MESTIWRINYYPLDDAVDFDNTYPLDSELHYLPFEQLGPGVESIVYLVVSARVQLKGLVWNDNRPCEIVLVERKRFTKRKTLTIKIKTEL